MKNNKLSKVYTSLYNLNEELVNLERFTSKGNSYEVWDVEFENNTIKSAEKKDVSGEKIETSNGEKSLEYITRIARKYSSISPAEILKFYKEKKVNDPEFVLRKDTKTMSTAAMIQYLNDNFKNFCLGDNKSKSGKGVGELACHLAFETTNWDNSVEPDVVVCMSNGHHVKISVKSFKSSSEQFGRGSARTGESEDYARTLIPKISELKTSLSLVPSSDVVPDDLYNSLKNINDLNQRMTKIKETKEKINVLKKEIIGEHNANYVFIWTGFEFIKIRPKASRDAPLSEVLSTIGLIHIKGSNSRVSFTFNPAFRDDYPSQYPDAYITNQDILDALNDDYNFNSLNDAVKSAMSNHFQHKKFTKHKMKTFYANHKADLSPYFTNANKFADRFTVLLDKIDKSRFKSYTSNSSNSPLSGRTFMDAIEKIESETIADLSSTQITTSITSSYVPKGKTLKEVYSSLYNQKKNIT